MSSSATTFEIPMLELEVPAEDLSALFIHGFTPMSNAERLKLSTKLVFKPPVSLVSPGPLPVFIKELNDLEHVKFFSTELASKGRYFVFVSNYSYSLVLLWHIALLTRTQLQFSNESWRTVQPLMQFMEGEMKNSDLAMRIINED